MTKAPPCTIAIFGAAGDLTKTLLMPSIYDLVVAGLLDDATAFIGLDHNARDADSWRNEIGDALHRLASTKGAEFQAGHIDETAWSWVAQRLDYQVFDFTNDAAYDALTKRLAGAGNVLFYLAVSPRFFEPIVAGLGRAGALAEETGAFRRVIIEKPFGHDLDSACKLNAALTAVAAETQLYRIDHFLGKEAVQGIPGLRFAGRFVEPLLNRGAVANVQITAAETIGVAERGSFYETTGALRDMIPNHLFSLLTQIAMDEPRSFDADDVRDAKAALLRAIVPIQPADAVRGQYAAGTVDGQTLRAYRAEDNVAADSRTETFAALRVNIDNDRWRGVPFYLRTGKRMSAHVTTIAVTLRPPGGPLSAAAARSPHLLVFGIDPQRGLVVRFDAKRPGVDLDLGPAQMSFRYDTTFDEPPNIGYETLLYHALCGNALLFQRADMIEAEWAAVAPVLDAWSAAPEPPEFYVPGADGPPGSDALLARGGDRWYPVAPLEALGVPTAARNGAPPKAAAPLPATA